MDNNQNYQSLTRTFTRLSRFQHLSAIAGWDMFAMMPPGGAPPVAKRWLNWVYYSTKF